MFGWTDNVALHMNWRRQRHATLCDDGSRGIGVIVVRQARRLAGKALDLWKGEPMPSMQPFARIEDYIATFPPEVRHILEQVRQAIRKAAPEAIETISYGIPTYDLDGRHLVFFAGWKHHIAVYPLPAGDSAFQQRVAPYKQVKSTIQLPLGQPMPYDLIADLVTFLMREKNITPATGDPEG